MCDRCEDLEFEVRRLQRILGANASTMQLDTVRRLFGVHPGQARVILALYQGRGAVTRENLNAIIYGNDPEGGPVSNVIDAQIRHIRNNCGTEAIKTVRGIGYELGTPVRRRIDKAVKEDALALI